MSADKKLPDEVKKLLLEKKKQGEAEQGELDDLDLDRVAGGAEATNLGVGSQPFRLGGGLTKNPRNR